MSIALVILAAGKGTRMQSDLPKVLHQIAHAPMLAHAMRAAAALKPARTIVVAGHGADQVRAAALEVDPEAEIVLQEEQKGTGHAVDQARAALADFQGDVVVLFGDTPFLQAETLDRMSAARVAADVVILGFETPEPARYGRLIMAGESLEKIVEYKDASDEERAITFCNSGILTCDRELLFSLIADVGDQNSQGEYYLTDIVEIANSRGHAVTAVACDVSETLGINSRADLARAEAVFQTRARDQAMADGVTLVAPETVQFAHDTVVGRDSVIEPNVVFGPQVSIESGSRIRAFSHLEGCHVSEGGSVGPYARLRPGTELAENVRIGNFVEVKNTQVDEGAKINHLTYIGDATIGARANIGAGTVTCNYDGVFKHRTKVGADAFIGSDTMLVAPVSVGAGAMTATGSVITEDVAEDALGVGRARQSNKPGFARKFFDRLREQKSRMNKDGT